MYLLLSGVSYFLEGWTEVMFFRTAGQARWALPPLRAAYCLHGTFCLKRLLWKIHLLLPILGLE